MKQRKLLIYTFQIKLDCFEKYKRNINRHYAKEKCCFLRILTGKTCALLNSAQKFIEIQGWLLLTFFMCLNNQLSSFNSIIVQMSEKRDS